MASNNFKIVFRKLNFITHNFARYFMAHIFPSCKKLYLLLFLKKNMDPPLYSGITWRVKGVKCFWNAHGVIFIDCLEKGRTITGAYYASLLDRFVDEISNKRPHLKEKKSFFMMTMHHTYHTSNIHRHSQAQAKSMNRVSNRFRIHRILQAWSPLTIICSQTSKDVCVIGISNRTKKLDGKQKGILEILISLIISKA